MTKGKRTKSPASAVGKDLDDLIDQITVDAYGDGEQLSAFRQDFEDEVSVPCDAFVVGERVSVIEFDFDGNKRRGLTARCRRADGSEHVVSAADAVLPADAQGARHLAAYRKWMGLSPHPRRHPHGVRRRIAAGQCIAFNLSANTSLRVREIARGGFT